MDCTCLKGKALFMPSILIQNTRLVLNEGEVYHMRLRQRTRDSESIGVPF